jgi:membrane associated rhomboid family serine protease
LRRDPLIEVFRSQAASDCRERALVLRAKGIPYEELRDPESNRLLVDEARAREALVELRDYEEENRNWPPKDAPLRRARGGPEGIALYATVLILVFVLDRNGAFGASWKSAGASLGGLSLAEPWRALTALTLHTGPPHLISNLIFGALFGYLVAAGLGGGIGWLAILVAGTLGNQMSAALRGPGTVSMGASTAVFAAVGILVGSEWRRRVFLRQRRLRRVAPFLMGALLLGYLGMGGENTDVSAHVTGLVAGLPIGALAAKLSDRTVQDRRLQIASGALALVLLLSAWSLAL